MSERSDLTSRTRRSRGFSLLELTIVLVMAGLVMGMAGLTFSGYFQRSSAKRAAQVFARDLALARSTALRSRGKVVIRFYESPRWYKVMELSSGSELATRRFGINADVDLSAIDLQFMGDSLVFSARGVASLEDAEGKKVTLGKATFTAGAATYSVTFNSLGSSKVEEG